ncbi:MAG: dimethylsulfonioproprionate lyase family protein [Paracoccaceae bacterium]
MTVALSFERLLVEARAAHASYDALRAFCDFPDDLCPAPLTPNYIAAAELMANDSLLKSRNLSPLAKAFVAAGPDAHWRETYKNTTIGDSFLDRFGCYALIGPNAPWVSKKFAAFVVYMPANLWYPRHHHPAEELYFVLVGEAEFHADGKASRVLRSGDSVFHDSGTPHATQTHDAPLLAYVLWRNHLGTPPVLSD